MGKFKRWTLVLIGVAILCVMVPVLASAAGDTIDTATSISLDSTYNGTISASNTNDFYKFTLTTSGKIQLTTSAYMRRISYKIYDANGKELWYTHPTWDSNTEKITTDDSFDLTSGTYYFSVSRYSSEYVGNYNFTLAFTSANETFKEGNGGNNNSMETANTISFNTSYYGQIATNDNKDFYKFTLSTSGELHLVGSSFLTRMYYRIYDVIGNEIWSLSAVRDNNTGKSTTDSYICLTSGTYYLAMIPQSNSYTGNYNFTLSFASAGESFKEGNGGNNNSMEAASPINFNTSYKGQIAINDDKDFYKFTLPAAGEIHFTATSYLSRTIYRIYDAKGNQLWYGSPARSGGADHTTADDVISLPAGTHYLAVLPYNSSATGNYNFIISYQLDTPKLTSVSNTTTGVKIDWNAVSGAAKYRVFYKVGGGSWTKIADTTSTSYTWTGAQSGTKYAFTVRCLSSDGKSYTSEYDTKGLSITYLAAPKITSVTGEAGSVTVKWGAVTGAAKYRVFYKTASTGGWKKIADTTSTSYKWTAAENGTTYTFTVRCVSSDGSTFTSDYDTKGLSITYVSTLATPKISNVTGNAGNVVIKWNAVTGAAKYRVFYKGDTGWKKIADTASTSYTWTAAEAGKTYTFTVRCVTSDGVTFTSDYDTKGTSYTVPSGKLATPKLSTITYDVTGVTIKWGSVSGAAKYRVFYKPSGATSWKKLADTTSTSYVWKAAENGAKYTFTVRCISADGNTFTSDYDTTGKTITDTTTLGTPKISGVSGTAGNVTIKWGAVTGAAKYRVFYKSGSSWKKIADTTSTSYTWTGAEAGTYTFTVRCVTSDGSTFTSNYDTTGVAFTAK